MTGSKHSQAYFDYRDAHPYCEVCGQPSYCCHHIKTVATGGGDEASNLLALCAQHHQSIHTTGDLQCGRFWGGALQAKIVAVKKPKGGR